jgi:hypothetical protein
MQEAANDSNRPKYCGVWYRINNIETEIKKRRISILGVAGS